MKIQMETLINASVEDTFNLFCDFENASKYIKDIEKVEMLTDGPTREGSVYRETRTAFGQLTTEEMIVKEWQKNEFCKLVTEQQGACFETHIAFAQDRHLTKVAIEVRCKPLSLRAKLSSPMTLFSKANIKRYMSNELKELKSVLEQS